MSRSIRLLESQLLDVAPNIFSSLSWQHRKNKAKVPRCRDLAWGARNAHGLTVSDIIITHPAAHHDDPNRRRPHEWAESRLGCDTRLLLGRAQDKSTADARRPWEAAQCIWSFPAWRLDRSAGRVAEWRLADLAHAALTLVGHLCSSGSCP